MRRRAISMETATPSGDSPSPTAVHRVMNNIDFGKQALLFELLLYDQNAPRMMHGSSNPCRQFLRLENITPKTRHALPSLTSLGGGPVSRGGPRMLENETIKTLTVCSRQESKL